MLITLNGCAIEWSSKLQPGAPALSATEAEYKAGGESIATAQDEAQYIAGAQTTQGIMHLTHVLEEIGFPLETIPTLKVDNSACVKIAKNPIYQGRMRHLEVKYHFLRHHVTSGLLSIVKIDSKANPADLLTKPLGRILFTRHRAKMVSDCNPDSTS